MCNHFGCLADIRCWQLCSQRKHRTGAPESLHRLSSLGLRERQALETSDNIEPEGEFNVNYIESAEDDDDGKAACKVRRTHGVPCMHMLAIIGVTRRKLKLEDFDNFWHIPAELPSDDGPNRRDASSPDELARFMSIAQRFERECGGQLPLDWEIRTDRALESFRADGVEIPEELRTPRKKRRRQATGHGRLKRLKTAVENADGKRLATDDSISFLTITERFQQESNTCHGITFHSTTGS